MAQLNQPENWFPITRTKFHNRDIHFHMGPTNSGKTQHSIEILKKAKKGCYLAPLRLLATQVHSELSGGSQDPETGIWRDGLICNLKTGPMRKIYKNATHLCAVIEMASYEEEYDVAVIDEIQMLEDKERGFNW